MCQVLERFSFSYLICFEIVKLKRIHLAKPDSSDKKHAYKLSKSEDRLEFEEVIFANADALIGLFRKCDLALVPNFESLGTPFSMIPYNCSRNPIQRIT